MRDKSAVFLDANILLEALFNRSAKLKADDTIRKYYGSSYISALTAHLVIHFGIKMLDLSVLRKFLADFNIIDLSDSDFQWAYNNMPNDDFEDALQLATAIKQGCTKLITFDKGLYREYKNLDFIEIVLLT